MIDGRSESHPQSSPESCSIRPSPGVEPGAARRTAGRGALAMVFALLAGALFANGCSDRPPEAPPQPRTVSGAPSNGAAAAASADGPSSVTPGEPEGAASAPAERFTVPSKTGTFWVQWTADPWPIPVSDPFALEVALFADEACTQPITLPDAGVPLSVDAGMPHHGHGMNVKPKVERLAAASDARFRVTGMLFHMPGRWELMFDLSREGLLERAQTTVHLNPAPPSR